MKPLRLLTPHLPRSGDVTRAMLGPMRSRNPDDGTNQKPGKCHQAEADIEGESELKISQYETSPAN